jgi:MscS family membrane protein
MNKTLNRIVSIVGLAIFLIIAVYFKINHEFSFSPRANRNMDIVLSVVITLLFLRLILESISAWYSIHKIVNKDVQKDNILVGLSNLFTIVSSIVIILGFFSVLGLKPSQVFTSLSIVAAAIAVVAKEFFAELIIGVTNGFTNKIDIDDFIKVGNVYGTIEDLGLQKVTLVNSDGKKIYISNIKFHNEDVVNFTKMDEKRMTLDFQLSQTNVESIAALEKALNEELALLPDLVDPTYHELRVTNITKESVDYRFKYMLNEIDIVKHQMVNSRLLKKIFSIIEK